MLDHLPIVPSDLTVSRLPLGMGVSYKVVTPTRRIRDEQVASFKQD